MKITLDSTDFAQLSESSQKEIINIMLERKNGQFDHSALRKEENIFEENPYDMSLPFCKLFMTKLHSKSRKFLKTFCETDGVATIEELTTMMRCNHKRDLNGIFAGLTRRLRKLDPRENSKAFLFETGEDNITGKTYYKVSAKTLVALKEYFHLE